MRTMIFEQKFEKYNFIKLQELILFLYIQPFFLGYLDFRTSKIILSSLTCSQNYLTFY